MEKFKEFAEKAIEASSIFFGMLFGIIRPALTQLFEILDEGQVSKRAAVWFGIGLTIYCITWVFGLVQNPPEKFSGTDIAAIIGAVLVPVAGLTGALMKYGDDRSVINNKEDNKNNKEE